MRRSAFLPSAHDMIWLSGWVFADLLLGLTIVFLASTRGSPPPTATPTLAFTPTATRTSTPTFTPTATATRAPTVAANVTLVPQVATPTPSIGLNSIPFTVTFRVSPVSLSGFCRGVKSAEDTVRNDLRNQITSCFQSIAGNSEAGIVLGFGNSPAYQCGNKFSSEVEELLQATYPEVFGNAVARPFHLITSDENGAIDLEIYFIRRPGLIDPISTLRSNCPSASTR